MSNLLDRLRRQLSLRCASNHAPDASHYSRRRYTEQYRAKVSMVKNLWIGFGIIWLCNQDGALLIAGSLATTLLSFVILDETN